MHENANLFAYVNGNITPWQDAHLHISDLAIQRGYGVFDYVKVQDSRPVFLDSYLQRFRESAQLMDMEVPLTNNQLREVVQELIKRNQLPQSGIKMILTGGYSPSGYNLAPPNLLVQQQELILPGPQLVQEGIRIITHAYVREIPRAKTINYTMGIRLLKEIDARGAQEVLYEQQGVVSEFPRCNFFIVTQQNTVVTPDKNVLLGVTRGKVLELAQATYKTEEREVTLDEVYQAKEVFLTSTTKRILPIVQVNDHVVGNGKPGNVTLHLLENLRQLEVQEIAAQV